MTDFFRNNVMIGLAEIICRLPLVFTVGYLARNIGTEIYGNWALIVAFQVFVTAVAGLGLSSSLSRHVPASSPEHGAAYLNFACAAALAVLVTFASVTVPLRKEIAQLLGVKIELDWLVPLAVLMAAGSAADGFLDAYFKARLAVRRQILFIISRTAIEVFAVSLVFVFTPTFLDQPFGRLAAYLGCVAVAKLVVYPLLVSGLHAGAPSLLLPASDKRVEFLRYGLPMVPSLLALWLVSQSDRVVLSHFVAKSELGIYAFAASLAAYMVFIGYAVYPLLLPQASRLYDGGNVAAVCALFRDAQDVFVLLWAGGMLCLALWSTQIIAWTGGNAFAGAAPIFLILCFSAGFDQLIGIYQYVFHLVKRTDLILWLHLGYAAIIVTGLTLAGFAWGIAGAPWAILGATVIFNIVRYFIAIRYLFIPMANGTTFKIAALAVTAFLLAHFAENWNVGARVTVTLFITGGLAIYLLRRKPHLTNDAVSWV